jgi:hypothetical protein
MAAVVAVRGRQDTTDLMVDLVAEGLALTMEVVLEVMERLTAVVVAVGDGVQAATAAPAS